jgi:hypothetical protein
MKKSLFFTSLILSLSFTQIFAAFVYTPDPLKKAVKSIESFDEGKAFLSLCQSKGTINLKWQPLGSDKSTACWIGHKREIILNSSREFNEGKKISSILFELNNSLTHEEFIKLNKLAFEGKISKKDFVEKVERIEYQNVFKTRKLLEKGVNLGIFPENCLLPIAPSFEEHFELQIQSGHSDAIAKQFDEIKHQGIKFNTSA